MKTEKMAGYFCTGEKCFYGYKCGADKEYPPVPKLGESTECPLAKYGMPGKRAAAPKDPVERIRTMPSPFDMLDMAEALCESCDHDRDSDEDFLAYCIDCPVYGAEEAIREGMAEAAIS